MSSCLGDIRKTLMLLQFWCQGKELQTGMGFEIADVSIMLTIIFHVIQDLIQVYDFLDQFCIYISIFFPFSVLSSSSFG